MKDREMILSDLLRPRRVRFDAGYGLESVKGHNRPHSALRVTAGQVQNHSRFGRKRHRERFRPDGQPYDELGVTTVINCEGTLTTLGSSILRPELEAVMAMAGRRFVSIPDLDVAAVEHAGMRTRRLQFVAKRSRSEK